MQGPRRVSLLISCIIETLFFGGISAGFGSLQYVLVVRGVYGQLCLAGKNITADFDKKAYFTNLTQYGACPSQTKQFSLAFTLGIFFGTISPVIFGHVLDRCGVRVVKLITAAIFAAGILCLAFTKPGRDWLVYPSLAIVSASGVIALSCNLKVAKFFPGCETLVTTFISGAFDSAAINFQFLKLAYHHDIPYMTFLLLYGAVGCSLFIFNSFLYLEEKPSSEDEDRQLISKEKEENPEGSNVVPFKKVVFSIQFLVYLLQFTVLYLLFYFFVSCNNTLIRMYFKGDLFTVRKYSGVFAYILMFGIAVSPLPAAVFYIQNRISPYCQASKTIHKSVIIPFCVATVLGLIAYVMVVTIPSTLYLYVVYAIIVVFRSFTFASGYAYLAVGFPREHLGKLFGTLFTIISFGCLLVFPLDIWLQKSLGPLYLFIGLTCLTILNPVYIYFKT